MVQTLTRNKTAKFVHTMKNEPTHTLEIMLVNKLSDPFMSGLIFAIGLITGIVVGSIILNVILYLIGLRK